MIPEEEKEIGVHLTAEQIDQLGRDIPNEMIVSVCHSPLHLTCVALTLGGKTMHFLAQPAYQLALQIIGAAMEVEDEMTKLRGAMPS